VKKLYVSSQVFLWCSCCTFEADTGEAVVLVQVNQPFKTCNDFIVRKSETGNVEAQHLRDHLSEIFQLQEQTERNY